MTETQQAQAAQAANGKAPGPASAQAAELNETGERWLGVLLIASAVFLALIGIDRVTGGALSGRLFSEQADASG